MASASFGLPESIEDTFNRILQHQLVQCAILTPARFIVGCSGGGDSLALTLLLHHWTRINNTDMLAVVVDHGLRKNSATEAAQTLAWLQQQSIPCQVLRVEARLTGNLQTFARKERYALLCQAAKDFQADAILLAHHRRDQAETVLDHLNRGSHALGLCGMFPITRYADHVFLRPVLQCSPETLRAYAESHAAPIIDDPSNQDRRFRRVILRQWLQNAPRLEQQANRLAEQAQHQAGVELAACRMLLTSSVSEPLPSILSINSLTWQNMPKLVQNRVLGSLIRYISMADYPPRRAKIQQANHWISHGKPHQITLGHVRLYQQNNTIWLYSDARPPATILKAQSRAAWGAGWQIHNNTNQTMEMRALGQRRWRELMPDFAHICFVGQNCPAIINPQQPEQFHTPYIQANSFFQRNQSSKLGADLCKTGLYFDKIAPIS